MEYCNPKDKGNPKDMEMKITLRIIANIHVNVNSHFGQDGKLDDLLFSLASLRLNEKTA